MIKALLFVQKIYWWKRRNWNKFPDYHFETKALK